MARLVRVALAIGATAALAGAALVVAGAGPSRAGASGRAPAPRLGVEIQAVFNAAGNPSLVANFWPNGGAATPHWSICPPGAAACYTVRTPHAFLETGPEPAGTRFEAIATYRGHAYRSSVTWHGRVRALTHRGSSARRGSDRP